MKVFRAPHFMLALALLGLAVEYYDAYSLYNGQQLWCPPPINGCNEVANSPIHRQHVCTLLAQFETLGMRKAGC
jgi:hypothetical protein